jgi:hypothetical protein
LALPAELWQTGTDEYDRDLALSHPVQSRDQRSKLRLPNVLQLVHKHHQGRAGLLGGLASGFQQCLQIVF